MIQNVWFWILQLAEIRFYYEFKSNNINKKNINNNNKNNNINEDNDCYCYDDG